MPSPAQRDPAPPCQTAPAVTSRASTCPASTSPANPCLPGRAQTSHAETGLDMPRSTKPCLPSQTCRAKPAEPSPAARGLDMPQRNLPCLPYLAEPDHNLPGRAQTCRTRPGRDLPRLPSRANTPPRRTITGPAAPALPHHSEPERALPGRDCRAKPSRAEPDLDAPRGNLPCHAPPAKPRLAGTRPAWT